MLKLDMSRKNSRGDGDEEKNSNGSYIWSWRSNRSGVCTVCGFNNNIVGNCTEISIGCFLSFDI